MTTTIFDLPRDLVKEIISRVPLKSMRAVRLTCKKLNNLSKSRSFSKMHLAKTSAREEESRMIVMMNYNLHLMSITFDENPSIERLGKLTCLNDSEQVKISKVFHCEGLLLCILKDNASKIVVWNPYSGQTRWIEHRDTYWGQIGWFMDMYKYALGCVNKKKNSCCSHKILMFLDVDIHPPGNPENRLSRYEIYDLDADLWRTLNVSLDWFIRFDQHGVSLKGNTYWCATKSNSEDKEDHLICFDFTRERFGPLLPLPFSPTRNGYVSLSCVKEEKLAALLTHRVLIFVLDVIEVWFTTKIEAEKVSWSKSLALYSQPPYTGSFFINEEKKFVMGFGNWNNQALSIVGETGYLRKLNLLEHKNCRSTYVCSYVPSLVQIKQPAGGKRKKTVKEQSPGGGKRRKRES